MSAPPPLNPDLFSCPDCGNQVSRSAVACPKCGRVFRSPPASSTAQGWSNAATIVAALIIVPFFLLMVGIAIVGLLSGP